VFFCVPLYLFSIKYELPDLACKAGIQEVITPPSIEAKRRKKKGKRKPSFLIPYFLEITAN
jgi:hypothetical protein